MRPADGRAIVVAQRSRLSNPDDLATSHQSFERRDDARLPSVE